jgi:hypothetical protein
MTDEDLLALVKSNVINNDYALMLYGSTTEDVVFTKTKELGKYQIYEVSFINVYSSYSDLFVAVSRNEEVHMVNWNEEFFEQELLSGYTIDVETAPEIIKDYVKYTAYYDGFFLLLGDYELAETVLKPDALGSVDQTLFSKPCSTHNKVFLCDILVVKDTDLFLRKFRVSKEMISYSDELLERDASVAFDLHD